MIEEKYQKAFYEGHDAGMYNDCEENCPYPEDSMEREYWLEGLEQGLEEEQ